MIRFDDADPAIQALAKSSAEARKNAYAPFSNFQVGAALLLENDSVVRGCNVENSTYGATICAERTACTKAISEGFQKFKAIAVCAEMAADQYTTPCGICRQFLFEFAPELPVYCVDPELTQIFITSMKELLPYGFRLKPPFTKPTL